MRPLNETESDAKAVCKSNNWLADRLTNDVSEMVARIKKLETEVEQLHNQIMETHNQNIASSVAPIKQA